MERLEKSLRTPRLPHLPVGSLGKETTRVYTHVNLIHADVCGDLRRRLRVHTYANLTNVDFSDLRKDYMCVAHIPIGDLIVAP